MTIGRTRISRALINIRPLSTPRRNVRYKRRTVRALYYNLAKFTQGVVHNRPFLELIRTMAWENSTG